MGLGLALEGQGEAQAAVAAYQRARHYGGLSANVQQYIETRLKSLQG